MAAIYRSTCCSEGSPSIGGQNWIGARGDISLINQLEVWKKHIHENSAPYSHSVFKSGWLLSRSCADALERWVLSHNSIDIVNRRMYARKKRNRLMTKRHKYPHQGQHKKQRITLYSRVGLSYIAPICFRRISLVLMQRPTSWPLPIKMMSGTRAPEMLLWAPRSGERSKQSCTT